MTIRPRLCHLRQQASNLDRTALRD